MQDILTREDDERQLAMTTCDRSRTRLKDETRYRVAVDVKRAADLYAQGWNLRQIGAELRVTATTVSHQLRRAGVAMRSGGASAHPASTQQILDFATKA